MAHQKNLFEMAITIKLKFLLSTSGFTSGLSLTKKKDTFIRQIIYRSKPYGTRSKIRSKLLTSHFRFTSGLTLT